MMTPEERFQKIENALRSVSESRARHDSEIEKNAAGIRDLIVASRTLLESQKEVTGQIRESREASREAHDRSREKHDRGFAELWELHKDTDAKLNALIAEVDRIIRRDKEQ